MLFAVSVLWLLLLALLYLPLDSPLPACLPVCRASWSCRSTCSWRSLHTQSDNLNLTQSHLETMAYVAGAKYRTGHSIAASSVKSTHLLAQLFCNPYKLNLEDAEDVITREQADAISLMLSHVMLYFNDGSSGCVSSSQLMEYIKYTDKQRRLNCKDEKERLELVKAYVEGNCGYMECNCNAHEAIKNKRFDEEFLGFLILLNGFDCIDPISDQCGAQIMVAILDYAAKLADIANAKASSKSSVIPVCCVLKDAVTGECQTYNALSDYILSSYYGRQKCNSVQVLLTGEVESSPAYQMMVSAVGQLSRRVISEIIGMFLLKSASVRLYRFKNWCHDKLENFTGPIKMEQVLPDDYYLRDANQCVKFFSHLVLVLQEVVNSPPPSAPARPRKRPQEEEEQGPSSKR